MSWSFLPRRLRTTDTYSHWPSCLCSCSANFLKWPSHAWEAVMAQPETIEEAIEQNARGPAKPHFGLRFTKIIPPGAG